jgi:hypothetical protein
MIDIELYREGTTVGLLLHADVILISSLRKLSRADCTNKKRSSAVELELRLALHASGTHASSAHYMSSISRSLPNFTWHILCFANF